MHILIVEDERQMAELLPKGLTEEGHSVEVAHTGPDGLATAQAGTFDVIVDDYLTKPFSFDVLLARLRAVSRRGPVLHGVVLQAADLVLDSAAHEVRRGGERVTLTRTEFNLLEFLMRRAGAVVPRRVLIEGVWGFEREIEDNTLDAFVRLLRQKIDTPGRTRLIRTVRGVGYSLREGDEP
jgi:DNA-binding response OmpR family regulator